MNKALDVFKHMTQQGMISYWRIDFLRNINIVSFYD